MIGRAEADVHEPAIARRATHVQLLVAVAKIGECHTRKEFKEGFIERGARPRIGEIPVQRLPSFAMCRVEMYERYRIGKATRIHILVRCEQSRKIGEG